MFWIIQSFLYSLFFVEIMKTPLYDEHVKLGAKVIDFNGWLMPVYYTSVIDEHINTRERAGLFDICHMGEFIVEGNDAFRLIQKIITNDLQILEDGKAFYSSMCLENGGIIDDLFVYRFNKNKFMVVVNAGNIEKDFKWFLKHKDFFDDVAVINKSQDIAKLDLQGPKAEDILQEVTNFDLKGLKRFYFVEDKVNNIPTLISRTGYTAEDGFELYFPLDKAQEQWNKLLQVGKAYGLMPIGLGARDTLRIEACYGLYGHELNEEINPLEAGIAFTVKFNKDFIGKEALLRQKDNLNRKIAAFEMLDKAIPRNGYDVLKNDAKIGFVSSGTFSPTFKKPIGLAMIDINETGIGNEIEIKIRDNLHAAKVVERPFYKYAGKH